MPNERLLFIDLLRIAGISMVIFEHVSGSSFYPFLTKYYFSINLFGGISTLSWGRFGVAVFLFASGCSLAYSDTTIRTAGDIRNFYSKRFLRIYPSYWTAILFSIMLERNILQRSFSNVEIFKYIIGFQAWGAKDGYEVLGKINGPLWFLTPLLSLYLMYPLLLYAIAKHPHLSLASFLAVSEISTYLLLQYYTTEPDWSPLYWLFIFCLGIYLTKLGWYPKTMNRKATIIFLSNLVFYVYLINEPLAFTVLQYPAVFFPALFIAASMFYTFDKQIRNLIGKLFKA